MHFEVYTDGSATTADKPGGYAYVICLDGAKILEGSGHIHKATNNVAEITAAIKGMEALDTYIQANIGNAVATGAAAPSGINVTLISDSQLTLRFATGEYTCRKYHLQLLVSQLKKQYQALNASTRWVKGHAGDTHNERCDELAKVARTNVPKDE